MADEFDAFLRREAEAAVRFAWGVIVRADPPPAAPPEPKPTPTGSDRS